MLGGFEVKNAAQGEAVAVIATFNTIDKDGDVTVPGAIAPGSEVVISPWNHSSVTHGALPVGKGVVRTTSKEARVDAQFFLDVAHGREAFEVVKSLGPLAGWSYGFRVLDAKAGEFQGKRVNFLKKLDVYEASPVALAAGVGTRTVTAKDNDEVFATAARHAAEHERIEQLRRAELAAIRAGAFT
nr:HK97 family phage prohead protease [Haloechinothrix aidingensis]